NTRMYAGHTGTSIEVGEEVKRGTDPVLPRSVFPRSAPSRPLKAPIPLSNVEIQSRERHTIFRQKNTNKQTEALAWITLEWLRSLEWKGHLMPGKQTRTHGAKQSAPPETGTGTNCSSPASD